MKGNNVFSIDHIDVQSLPTLPNDLVAVDFRVSVTGEKVNAAGKPLIVASFKMRAVVKKIESDKAKAIYAGEIKCHQGFALVDSNLGQIVMGNSHPRMCTITHRKHVERVYVSFG